MDLRTYLETNGQTPAQLAERAGVSHTTLWRLLSGRHVPQAVTRRRIAAATGGVVSEDDVLRAALPPLLGEKNAA